MSLTRSTARRKLLVSGLLFAYALVTIAIFVFPNFETLLPAFASLLAAVLVAYAATLSARPFFWSRNDVLVKGLLGTGNRIHVLELFIVKSMENQSIEPDSARMSVSRDEYKLGLYKQDFRFLRIVMEVDTGFFILKVQQSSMKKARNLASKTISIFRESAVAAETTLKVLSVHPPIAEESQMPLFQNRGPADLEP